MQYYWRIFLWENGKKSNEYSDSLLAPVFFEEKLDEQLDSGEIILEAMPIFTKNAFPPKTKFRLERYTTKDYSGDLKKWDLVVEHDDVEEYAGCPNICCHRINLIEASVIAQGMHVDNIALTYELQDVDLNYRTVESDDTRIGKYCGGIGGGDTSMLHKDAITRFIQYVNGVNTVIENGEFINTYRYAWDADSFSGEIGIANILSNIHAGNSLNITFNVPRLYVWGCYSEGTETRLFELNTVTRVKKVIKKNGAYVSESYVTLLNGEAIKYCGAASLPVENSSVYYSDGTTAYLRKIISWENATEINQSNFASKYTTFPAIAKANAEYADKSISFNTDLLSNDQLNDGYTIEYYIECVADSAYQNGMVGYYKQVYHYDHSFLLLWDIRNIGYSRTDAETHIEATQLKAGNTEPITCYDISIGKTTPFIMKGVKYSCYDLLRKALLTCDTQVIDSATTSIDEYGITDDSSALVPVPSIDYPIIVDTVWANRLKTAKVNETIFEGKNLWEVLIQIGYYLHAIPYLEFYDDPTNPIDKFILTFRQLGDTREKANTSTKITIFNSNNLSEYFSQYDSYVTNLFSPQNLCEERLVCKTSDASFLVSNDTAELQLKYAITEIVEFYITYNGEEKEALQYIFEQSIYNVLTNADPSQVSPAKGNSIYYALGDNKIQGLSYVAPNVNAGDNLMALKYIMQKLFGVQPSIWTQTYTFNNLRFRVKYRTQDTARVTQFRPDLERFMKNSSLEKYPHHEQFYGQQDKIIDSERFSANLFGKLIRVGNGVYQCQEYARLGEEKEAGDLVQIGDKKYYVTAIDNEYYPDAIYQKVTYSQNFNQLANIVTIPSEPRFYEVSERSKVRREVRLQEFFTLSTEDAVIDTPPRYIRSLNTIGFIIDLIFNKDRKLPNYAWTRFMADKFRKHEGSYGQYIPTTRLFPSSDIKKTGNNTVEPLEPSDHSDCIVPLLHFPLHDGIVFEWDMDDNFKAGDMLDTKVSGGNTADGAYLSQQPLRYVDIMGRADLFKFKLFSKTDWTGADIQQLPKPQYEPTNETVGVQGEETKAIALDKDNREEISFNYQINLLHRASENDDDFITFPNIFGEKDSDLYVCLLNQTQSLFDENVNITTATTLADRVPYMLEASTKGSLQIKFTSPTWIDGADISQVKSIVFYQENENFGRTAYIAKNVAKLPDGDKLQNWYIYPTFNN